MNGHKDTNIQFLTQKVKSIRLRGREFELQSVKTVRFGFMRKVLKIVM